MAAESDSLRRARPLLGTFVEIAVAGAPRAAMEVAVEAAFGAIEKVHRLMSFHDSASDIGRLNREAAARAVAIDAWTFEVLEMAADLHRRSNGLFDIAVAPALQRLGLLPDDGENRRRSAIGTADGIDLLARSRVRFCDPGIRIDLGGIAKGFAVDRAVETLRRAGMPQGFVNAGGDLATFGAMPMSVDLRNPRDPGRILCRIEIKDEALASTGGGFDPFHSPDAAGCAIVDPRSQRPTRRLAGATVRAPSCMIADALTKLVMIDPQSAIALLKQERAGALIVSGDGEVSVTREWDGALAA